MGHGSGLLRVMSQNFGTMDLHDIKTHMGTEVHCFYRIFCIISFFVTFIMVLSSSSSLFGFDLIDGVVSMSNFVSVHDVDELTYDDDDDGDEEDNMTAVENENLARGNSDNSGASIVRSGTS